MSNDAGVTYRWLTEEDLNGKVRAAVLSTLDGAITEINAMDGYVYDESTIRACIETLRRIKDGIR